MNQTVNKAPIGSRWKFTTDNSSRTWIVTDRKPGGIVEYQQEGRARFGQSHLRDWLRNAERIDDPTSEVLGALKAAEEYMASRATACSEPYPLERARAAIAKAEGQS